MASARCCTARHFDKALHDDVQRLSRRLPFITFSEELLVAVEVLKLYLVGNPAYIRISDALEDRHTLHDGLDRPGIVQAFKEGTHRRHDLNQALHDLFRNFQHYRGSLRTRGGVALLTRQHAALTHKLASPQDRYRQVLAIGASRRDGETSFKD